MEFTLLGGVRPRAGTQVLSLIGLAPGAPVAVGPATVDGAAALDRLAALIETAGVVAAGADVDLGDGFRSARIDGGTGDRRDALVALLTTGQAGGHDPILVNLFGQSGAAAAAARAGHRFAALRLAASAAGLLDPAGLDAVLVSVAITAALTDSCTALEQHRTAIDEAAGLLTTREYTESARRVEGLTRHPARPANYLRNLVPANAEERLRVARDYGESVLRRACVVLGDTRIPPQVRAEFLDTGTEWLADLTHAIARLNGYPEGVVAPGPGRPASLLPDPAHPEAAAFRDENYHVAVDVPEDANFPEFPARRRAARRPSATMRGAGAWGAQLARVAAAQELNPLLTDLIKQGMRPVTLTRAVREWLARDGEVGELWSATARRPLTAAIQELAGEVRPKLTPLTHDAPLPAALRPLARNPGIAAARTAQLAALRLRSALGRLLRADAPELARAMTTNPDDRLLRAAEIAVTSWGGLPGAAVKAVRARGQIWQPPSRSTLTTGVWEQAWADAAELGGTPDKFWDRLAEHGLLSPASWRSRQG
ncbi:hypothetical protein [Actinoplanes sp. TFC3]|uniref:hypothetical protein n=1 Tax=Actinoplanes sp. TFC3 TaxID=1710355 RepID=UPI00083323E9|nr:hypothetical protein [Actinoplanes sp. TFC3]